VASGTKAVESPRILSNIVAQDIVVSVLGAHPEVGRIPRVPLAVQILDFVFEPAKNESQWPLISAVAGIALDMHLDYRSFHVPPGSRCGRSVALSRSYPRRSSSARSLSANHAGRP
jgi:hypothetical protein